MLPGMQGATQAPVTQMFPPPQSVLSGSGTWVQPLSASQSSVVQGLESSQSGAGPPTHWLSAHVSSVVQALPSVQTTSLGAFMQPTAGSQESSVQTLSSLQSIAPEPTQTPVAHVSVGVQALLSSQFAVLWPVMHPNTASHESSVQTLPSLQLRT